MSGPLHPNRTEFSLLARHSATVLAATLLLQGSAFAILAIAALVLPVPEFAAATIFMAVQVLTVAATDLGINTTMTKLYAETGDEEHIRSATVWRSVISASTLAVGLVVWLTGHPSLGLGIVSGSIVSLWNGRRASDIAQQCYRRLAISSAAFCVARIAFGFTALFWSRDGEITMIAMNLLPAFIALVGGSHGVTIAAFSRARTSFRQFSIYAFSVHVGQLAHIAVLNAPILVAERTLTIAEVGTLGLALTLCSPIPLLINAARSAILPRFLGTSRALELWLWGRGGMTAIALISVVMLTVGLGAATLVATIYDASYAGVATIFLVYYSGVVLSGMLGLYSMSVHTQGIPHLAAWIHSSKAALLVIFLLYFHHSALAIVGLVTALLVLGEATMIACLYRKRPQVA